MKHGFVRFLLMVFTVLAAAATQAGQGNIAGTILIRMEGASAGLPCPDVRLVLRMDGYSLAITGQKGVEQLDRAKIRFRQLGPVSGGADRSYFLVQCLSADCAAAVCASGIGAIPVSENEFVFSGGMEQIRKLPHNRRLARIETDRPSALLRQAVVTEDPAAEAIPLPTREQIQKIVAQVTNTRYRNNIRKLQDFGTRYYGTAGCESAASYLHRTFESYGLVTRYQRFPVHGTSTKNVIGVQPGLGDPTSILVLSGHYDSYSPHPQNAPGADDNASGTAAVVEAARVLSRYKFDFTIHYAAFGGEEMGLYGSQFYATKALEHHQKIIGVLNLDMVAYVDREPEDLDVISNPASRWLGSLLAASAQTYAQLPTFKIVVDSWPYSDHSPFWHRGYPALTAIEDEDPANPYYHTPGDRLETLTTSFGYHTTRALVATAAVIGQPFDENRPKPPKGLKATVYRSAEAKKVVLELPTLTGGTYLGCNVYRSHASHRGYVRLNSRPLWGRYTDRRLPLDSVNFYVITLVRKDGIASHPSSEVNDIQ